MTFLKPVPKPRLHPCATSSAPALPPNHRQKSPAGRGRPDRPEGKPLQHTLGTQGLRNRFHPEHRLRSLLEAQEPQAPAERCGRDAAGGCGEGMAGMSGDPGCCEDGQGWAGEGRADRISSFAGALQNGLERERGKGLCRVLR